LFSLAGPFAVPWYGTGHNFFDLSRETLTSTYPGQTDTGFLNLTITPSTNPLEGGEIQTTSGYGYGYYEVSMKPSAVPGGVASFFLIGAPNYSAPEFDIVPAEPVVPWSVNEFLLNSKNQVTDLLQPWLRSHSSLPHLRHLVAAGNDTGHGHGDGLR
jgi:beta-glucanase (GH16 family)